MRKGGLGALERLPPTILSILSNIIDKPTPLRFLIAENILTQIENNDIIVKNTREVFDGATTTTTA